MKQVPDFNDLANRSVLGKEALDRQVRSAVQDAVAKKVQTGALRQAQSAERGGNGLRLG